MLEKKKYGSGQIAHEFDGEKLAYCFKWKGKSRGAFRVPRDFLK
jgi:hypothetical protein